ncbi:fanconi-associated nuclease 1 homolog isoform X2 [Cornus florida]|uniref:fanconi-associated nuclease 1 homolog isoform X2 n=1 Tax=Cornus florida TaxID=4283 RepID=UPI00289B5A64|nr:fanconi-associated nuclease 1 homolog isoform X2 [Cornus florida]
MLTGRESLIRLVGRRRRFLPNRQSLLSTPIQSSLNRCKEDINGGPVSDMGAGSSSDQREDRNGGPVSDMGAASSSDQRGKCVVETSASDRVTCPVCGNTVSGENDMINSHLDACLARGTKRKLSQSTLLQLNFCSRSKVKICSSKPDHIGISFNQMGSDNIFVCDAVHKLHDFVGIEENDSSHCKSPLNSEYVMQPHMDASIESSIIDDSIYYGVDSTLALAENETPNYEMAESLDSISGVVLETFIVGRRFSDEMELNPGATISLLRDPDNVKDPNAVKVLSADSECCKVLGFLPRELAQYLSPLMDNYGLSFEGCITSAPKHALAVVPIQIACQSKISCAEKEDDLQEVLRSYSHLFTYEEKVFLETFTSLSDDSQRLFVRLYTRKGPWFRMSSFSYPEISDCQHAVEGLSATGYICSIKSKNELRGGDLKEVLNVLNVFELREILCALNKKCNRSTRKQDYIATLISLYEDGLCPLLPSEVLKKTEACVRISSTAEYLIWRAERLFFLNGEQDLSAFLLVDLGVVKYPKYTCIISGQIFSERQDLLSYEEALEVAQIMDESLNENNFELVLRCIEISDSRLPSSSTEATQSSSTESMATFLSCFSASWVYSKVVLLGVSFLEHEHRYNTAINLLKRLLIYFTADGRRGYWTLRLSIDLEHVGRLNESLSVAEGGLLDRWIRAGSRMALQRRVLRLGKPPRRWRTPSYSESVKRKITEVHIQGRPLNCETGMKSRFYGEDGEQCGVEQLALQYYAEEGGGWQGVHTESGIWLTIFGLLMWDIIFTDVPNVFRTRFQSAPLDFETDSFYEVRKNLIESHLQKLCDGMAEEILITSWESHVGTTCRGVNWDRHSLSVLRAAVSCIRGPCLASICRHLSQDYRSWSSGMPDLLLWRFHGDYSGEAKLVEVKGPRDRLSEQQRAWLLFLMDCGFNTEVCKVTPAPIST